MRNRAGQVRGKGFRRIVAAGIVVLGCVAGAASAQAPTLHAVESLDPGKWQLRDLDEQREVRTVCLPDPTALIQIEHRGGQCSRFVVANEPREATVHYTCPGRGHGRTTVQMQTPRRILVTTQGVARGSPFHARFDGRRVGTCR
ncbi:DUF3617 domain-containing protein [Stakelama saccharophila]|uniref:DUF3617 family protein n=1 Tax=Stakelama saccharophila TaxID=3075605 RepID=A0ABZ0BBN4_9SPHN|nr:hypothetical protein [Stakelama sp. W311]WNO54763.1 hypothetical protein RPR59_05815 [Stakelama sp. W311]